MFFPPFFINRQYSTKHGLMSIVGEFEFSFLMFHLGEDFEVGFETR